jgi:hypothetical protein
VLLGCIVGLMVTFVMSKLWPLNPVLESAANEAQPLDQPNDVRKSA